VLGAVTPVLPYKPKTWGPDAASELTADVGGWFDPQV